jgi:hypothetical protein
MPQSRARTCRWTTTSTAVRYGGYTLAALGLLEIVGKHTLPRFPAIPIGTPPSLAIGSAEAP